MAGLNIYLMVSKGRVIGKTNTPRDAITQTGWPPSGKAKEGKFHFRALSKTTDKAGAK